MLRRLRIAPRMALATLLGAGGVLAVVVLLSAGRTEQLVLQKAQERAHALADDAARRLNEVGSTVSRGARLLARILEARTPTREETRTILAEVLEERPEVFGTAAAFAPGEVPWAPKAAPYLYRSGGTLAFKDLAEDPAYGYEGREWYAAPRASGEPHWSEPYDDVGGGDVRMITYSVPLSGPRGAARFRGVVTCDLSLEWFSRYVGSLPLGESGYAFFLRRRDGRFLAHPDRSLILRSTLFEIAAEKGRPALADLARRMCAGETGFVAVPGIRDGESALVAFRPLNDWLAVGVVQPRAAVTAPARRLATLQLAAGGVGFVLLLGVAWAVAASITRPLRQLERATRVLASGNLDAPLPPGSTADEVGRLAAAFSSMAGDLKRHVAELARATAAREKLEQELAIARSIQLSLVPSPSELCRGRGDVDLWALLEPAREVGGDLYDVFLLDGDTLALAIGDVSGKGVPASLFMARALTLLRTHLRTERDVARLLARLNAELCESNAAGLFVTLFCAVVDLPTGRGRFGSAGHNPPLLVSRDGTARELPIAKGFVLGMLERATFEELAFTLGEGDTLVLCTDGVTEAMDASDEPYGDERLAAVLGPLAGHPAREVVGVVRESVRAHAGGAEQSDDIALVACRRLPRPAGGS